MKDKWKRIATVVGVAVFWIAVWELLSLQVDAPLLLPSPWEVVTAWWKLCGTGLYWRAAAVSLLRVLGGFVAAVVCGCALAALTAASRFARKLLAPLLHIVRAAPVASFILLALVWIRSGQLPIVISFLMVVPVVWDAVEQGILQTSPSLLEMARVYRLSRWEIFWRVRVPSVVPYLLTAMTTGVGFAWKSAVAAEVICRPADSIGDYLYAAKQYLETPEIFVWTATVIILSVVLTAAVGRLTAPLAKRYGGKEAE